MESREILSELRRVFDLASAVGFRVRDYVYVNERFDFGTWLACRNEVAELKQALGRLSTEDAESFPPEVSRHLKVIRNAVITCGAHTNAGRACMALHDANLITVGEDGRRDLNLFGWEKGMKSRLLTLDGLEWSIEMRIGEWVKLFREWRPDFPKSPQQFKNRATQGKLMARSVPNKFGMWEVELSEIPEEFRDKYRKPTRKFSQANHK